MKYKLTLLLVLLVGYCSRIAAQPCPITAAATPACNGMPISFTVTNGAISYQWTGPNFSQSVQNPTIASANAGLNNGTYTVTATFAGNCTATASVAINVITQLNGQALNNGPACIGNNVSLTATGGNDYAWAGPNGYSSTAQNPVITNATAAATGVYTVTVTGFGACSSVATTSVVVTPCNTCDDSGCKGANLVLNGDFAQGNTGFTSNFIPNNGNGTCTPGSNCNGQFMCQYGYAISNTAPPCNPGWSPAIQDHTPTGNGNFMLVDFPTGVAPNNIWCQTVTLQPNTDYCMGGYFINLLPIGNTSTDPRFQFSVNGAASASVFSVDNDEQWQFKGISYNSGAGGAMTFCIQNANYGTVGYDVALDDISIRPLLTGNNPITATDNINLCTGITTATINPLTNDNGGSGTLNPTSISIYTAPPFSLGTAVLNTNGTVTFTASPAFTSGTTTLTYQVCNTNGCCSTADVIVSMGAAPVISTSSTNTNCGAPIGTASASSAESNLFYSWSTGTTGASINGLAVGIYTVTATNTITGCTASATAEVQLQGVPVIQIANNPARCGLNNGSATASLIITIGVNYAWSNGQSGATISNLTPGTYTVTASGTLLPCSITQSVTIAMASQAAVVSLSNQQNSSCNAANGSITAALSNGGGSFIWSNGVNMATNANVSAGIYTVTASTSNNCTASISTTITTTPVPAIAVTQTPAICGNTSGTATMSVTNGVAISALQWETIPVQTTATISNLTFGTIYTVGVITADGCTATASITMSGSPAPTLTLTPQDATCGQANGQILASSTIAINSLSWNNGSIANPVVALNAGVYTVTATDANGCTIIQSATVIGSNGVPIQGVATPTSCNSTSDGVASVLVFGGGFIDYLWSNGQTIATIGNLSAGSYTVTVTRHYPTYDCTASATVVITSAYTPLIAVNTSPANCGLATGSASLTFANAPIGETFSYLWSTGATTNTLTGLAPTTGGAIYTVTVTSSTGCSATASFTIANTGTPVDVLTGQHPSICGFANGTLTALATSPATLTWSNGATGTSVPNVAAGTYTVTATNGVCSSTSSIIISNSPTPIVNLDTNSGSCGLSNGSISVQPKTNVNPSYLWSTGAMSSAISNLATGTYTVTVSLGATCSTSTSFTIVNPVTFTSTTTARPTTCGVSNGSVNTIPLGTTNLIFNYQWSNTATTQEILNLSAGVYTVTITASNGCTLTQSATVQSSVSTLTPYFTSNPVINQGQQASLEVFTNIPATNYTWNNGATGNPITVSPAVNTTYTVTVSLSTGCSGTASVFVVVNEVKWNIPTIFTPNGDGENDTYYIVQYGGLEIISFQVYNRWGVLLHDKPNKSWDGKKDGEPQPIDTYVYKIEVKYPDNTTEIKVGDFLLVR